MFDAPDCRPGCIFDQMLNYARQRQFGIDLTVANRRWQSELRAVCAGVWLRAAGPRGRHAERAPPPLCVSACLLASLTLLVLPLISLRGSRFIQGSRKKKRRHSAERTLEWRMMNYKWSRWHEDRKTPHKYIPPILRQRWVRLCPWCWNQNHPWTDLYVLNGVNVPAFIFPHLLCVGINV